MRIYYIAVLCLLALASTATAQNYSAVPNPPAPGVSVKSDAQPPPSPQFPIAASLSYSIDGAGLAHVQFQAKNTLPPSQAQAVSETLTLTMSGLVGTTIPPSITQTYPLIRPAQNSLFKGSATITIPLAETPSMYPASWTLTKDANGSYLNIPLTLDGQQSETDTFTLAYPQTPAQPLPGGSVGTAASSPAAAVGSQPQAIPANIAAPGTASAADAAAQATK